MERFRDNLTLAHMTAHRTIPASIHFDAVARTTMTADADGMEST